MVTKKTPKHDTWMPLYVNDYLGDTMRLTTEQHGAYLLLIMSCWKNEGKVPGDAVSLAAITRLSEQAWKRMQPVIEPFFFCRDDFWLHKRVLEELEKAKAMVAKRSKAGKAGARATWGLPPIDGEQ